MAARTFEDSTGTIWEVFEVHRSSTRPGAVSGGLEQGWLAFTSGETKRRLAPFPRGWESSSDPELERLCSTARVVSPVRYPFDPSTRDRRRKERQAILPTDTGERRRTAGDAAAEPHGADERVVPPPTADEKHSVEATVRHFAHDARAQGLPAIAAMVQLKALLAAEFSDDDPVARDLHSVRRWFVESFYFERKG